MEKQNQNQENFVFGWVSDQIRQNFAAWSSWKDYGDANDEERFWQTTHEEAENQGLTWFSCEDEDA